MEITAAVARGVGAPFVLETVTLEEPRPDEIRVRLVATGICHTDVSMRDHKIYPVPHPVILGHEGAGIVEAVGSAVSKVAPGDRGDPDLGLLRALRELPGEPALLLLRVQRAQLRRPPARRIEPVLEERRDHPLLPGPVVLRDAYGDPRAGRGEGRTGGAARDARDRSAAASSPGPAASSIRLPSASTIRSPCSAPARSASAR